MNLPKDPAILLSHREHPAPGLLPLPGGAVQDALDVDQAALEESLRAIGCVLISRRRTRTVSP